MRLGPAEVLGHDKARAEARAILSKVTLGEDPQAQKIDRRSKDQRTLRSLADRYFTARKSTLRERSLVEAKRYLTGGKNYFRSLYSKPIDAVTRKDVSDAVSTIERESGGSTASRARAALSSFYVWAMTMGLADANPVNGSYAPSEGDGRDRVLSDDELAAIWQACTGEDDYSRCVRLLILTGCRRQEIGGMAWSEIKPDGTWTIPEARSKNGRAHVLPIMPMISDVIDGVPHGVHRDQLFGSRGDGFTAWSRGKKLLDAKVSLEAGWTIHDIRRTVATGLGDLGVLPHIVEVILNHAGGSRSGVAGTYNRSLYENEVRSALARWHDRVRTVVDGGERKVISIRSKVAS